MVYPGSRSSGCGLCRRRKIKCDERRPHCRRCQVYKTQCPGYDRPLEIRVYGGQNRSVCAIDGAHTKTREQIYGPVQPPLPIGEPGVQGDRIGQDAALDLGINIQPSTLWDQVSLNYFLGEYGVTPLQGIYSGHLEYLPNLLLSCSSMSPLKSATRAASYLTLSRHAKSPQLYILAREHYGHTLQFVGKMLSLPPETWRRDTIAAIMLLHMFEDIDGEEYSDRASHLCGIAAAYKARGQNLLSRLPGCSLYASVFSQLQIHAFTTDLNIDCISIPQPVPNMSHPPTGVAIMIAAVGGFWSSLATRLEAIRASPAAHAQHQDTLDSAMRQAMWTQSQLNRWVELLPEVWKPKTVRDENGHLLVTYLTRWLGLVWAMYYSTLILFYHSVLRCCRSVIELQNSNSATPEDAIRAEMTQTTTIMAKENVARATSNLCDSIPFVFGDVDEDGKPTVTPDVKGAVCYHMIWPLVLVIRSYCSASEQVALCTQTLGRIQDLYGINLSRLALKKTEGLWLRRECGFGSAGSQ